MDFLMYGIGVTLFMVAGVVFMNWLMFAIPMVLMIGIMVIDIALEGNRKSRRVD